MGLNVMNLLLLAGSLHYIFMEILAFVVDTPNYW